MHEIKEKAKHYLSLLRKLPELMMELDSINYPTALSVKDDRNLLFTVIVSLTSIVVAEVFAEYRMLLCIPLFMTVYLFSRYTNRLKYRNGEIISVICICSSVSYSGHSFRQHSDTTECVFHTVENGSDGIVFYHTYVPGKKSFLSGYAYRIFFDKSQPEILIAWEKI